MDTKILLPEDRIPKQWYNIIPDMPGPLAPVIHPGTLQPVTPDDLLPLFPMGLIEQEVSSQRWIDIPEEVREIYRLWRPAPLYRARRRKRPSAPRQRSTTRTRGAPRPAPTSRTPPSPRPTTTRSSARSGSPARPAPASGAPPSPLPARCSAWSAPSTW